MAWRRSTSRIDSDGRFPEKSEPDSSAIVWNEACSTLSSLFARVLWELIVHANDRF